VLEGQHSDGADPPPTGPGGITQERKRKSPAAPWGGGGGAADASGSPPRTATPYKTKPPPELHPGRRRLARQLALDLSLLRMPHLLPCFHAMRSPASMVIALALCWSASATEFKYRTYGAIVKVFEDLQTKQPGLVDIYSAQERYGLPSAGSCTDADGKSTPCQVR
jgi:hypothetical protein